MILRRGVGFLPPVFVFARSHPLVGGRLDVSRDDPLISNLLGWDAALLDESPDVSRVLPVELRPLCDR